MSDLIEGPVTYTGTGELQMSPYHTSGGGVASVNVVFQFQHWYDGLQPVDSSWVTWSAATITRNQGAGWFTVSCVPADLPGTTYDNAWLWVRILIRHRHAGESFPPTYKRGVLVFYNTVETVVLTKFTAPTGVSVTDITDTGATLSWNAHATALSYEWKLSPGGTSGTVTGTEVTFTGLTPGADYTASVAAKPDATQVTTHTISDFENLAFTTTKAGPKPEILSVVQLAPLGKLRVTITPVDTAIGYQYHAEQAGGDSDPYDTTETAYVITLAAADTIYNLRVRAKLTATPTYSGWSPVKVVFWTALLGTAVFPFVVLDDEGER